MKTITNINQLDLNSIYSYADYLTWSFKERVEIIKGKLLKMSLAPNRLHQTTSRQICGHMWEVFKNTTGEYFDAPFDVRLVKKIVDNKKITTVVQPDICIVCDQTKLDSAGCIGAPDLIVEILSPGNTEKEMNIKYDLYEANAVKEYWIVDPERQTINVYILEEGKYRGLKPFTIESTIKSTMFPKLKISLKEIF